MDPFAALAPELRALDPDAAPEEVRGVLQALFSPPLVPKDCEGLAGTLCGGGYDNLTALSGMGREGLTELGLGPGHKDMKLSLLNL